MTGKRAGKLLLVEDEHLLRGLIAQFLRGEGFEVIEAADGSQGANLFQCMRPFDVVLLDLNLPELPGVEVCRRIKSEEPSQPVIICSAAIIDAHLARLRELNVEQFLTKPYHPRDLLDCIDAEIARASASCPKVRRLAPIAHPPNRRSASGHPVAPPTHTLFKTPILD